MSTGHREDLVDTYELNVCAFAQEEADRRRTIVEPCAKETQVGDGYSGVGRRYLERHQELGNDVMQERHRFLTYESDQPPPSLIPLSQPPSSGPLTVRLLAKLDSTCHLLGLLIVANDVG